MAVNTFLEEVIADIDSTPIPEVKGIGAIEDIELERRVALTRPERSEGFVSE